MPPRIDPGDRHEVDALDGLPLPSERTRLIGHRKAEHALLEAYRSDRLHHAWILGGPKGIGKATLAFRFAAFALAHPDRFGPDVAAATDLSLPANHPVAHQARAGGHPNILHLRRPWDDKQKRFKTELPVDEVRRTISFFGTTASARAWRVCIVDAADDMNANSANALLKVLEEPPPRCLFLVLSHTPGRLLPTIRSRCRRLDLSPLSVDEIRDGLAELLPGDRPGSEDLADIARFADGSLRSAITLLSGDGIAIARGFTALAEQQRPDLAALHGLGDLVSARGKEDNWISFQTIAAQWLHERMRRELRTDLGRAGRYADLWEHTTKTIADADALNLDRKQVVLELCLSLARLAA